MKAERKFWDRVAKGYNRLAKTPVYQKLNELILPNISEDFEVLDLGCASGFIARAIASRAKSVYAVDYSEEMIAKAKKISKEPNVYFSVQDATNLSFSNKSFDVVILANVLHIMDRPEACLSEVKRVLKENGLLIAPVYLWKNLSFIDKLKGFFMKLVGFPLHSKWSEEEYLNFLKENGFTAIEQLILKDSVDMCYVVCKLA